MKISNENKFTIYNETDFMNMINEFQDKYEEVYWNTIEGQVFVYRTLGRLEYKEVLNSDTTDIEKEDIVCKACLLYPENFDFDECTAGIPTMLFKSIMKNSFLDDLKSKQFIINYNRLEMQQFDNQITCIINEAFPNIDISEIENWGMSKTAKYLSRAEWKLNVLRQIPVDYEMSDKLMENEWNTMHSQNEENDNNTNSNTNTNNNINTNNDINTNNNIEFKVETFEERQKRLKNSTPRKRSKEEIEMLKRKFPELNWEYEVDPNKDIDSMKDNIDTLAPALRPGW